MSLPSKIFLTAIVCIHFVLGGVYWYLTPYGEPPDEIAHGEYIEWLDSSGVQLPVMGKDDAGYEAHQPPLYYILALPFSLSGEVTSVRLLSLILGGLSILVIYWAAVDSSNDDRLALGAAGFVALLPTHLMLSSMVSNDILAELIFGLALLLMIGRPSWGNSLALGLVLGLGLLSKATCILLFPIAVFAFLFVRRRSIEQAGAILGIGLLVGGWWLVRNQMLYIQK